MVFGGNKNFDPPHLRDIEQDTPPSDGGGGGGSYYEPSETAEDACRRCKEEARATIEVARIKRDNAFADYLSKKNEISGRFQSDFFESWAVGIGFAAIVIEGGSVFVATPIGALGVSSVALLLGGISTASSFIAKMNAAEADAGSNFRAMQNAESEWNLAVITFEDSLRTCGTCN
ncbi:hypothetical protein [Rudanella lutea]|uniref:hypothetical protein n=1 Tax=Rudanella lutea TaxID=451374 RepID=UPI0005C4DF41|nr:hypothetical protein [Rudanella lutea]